MKRVGKKKVHSVKRTADKSVCLKKSAFNHQRMSKKRFCVGKVSLKLLIE